MSQTEMIQLVSTPPFKALAVRTTMTADKEGTRRAWRALTELFPLSVERIDIPGSLCIRIQVKGDEKQMIGTYEELFSWVKHNGEYELDTNEGVWGFEANRLVPVNPLTIPYQEIKLFDYDMLYPVRKRSGM